jgi:c(7)-type cytochrome triheme protein
LNWVQALDLGLIKPSPSILEKDYQAVAYKKELDIPANWALIPPAAFHHDKHMQWLDCGDCHPGIFNVKVKSTMHFEMRYILEGKFCGVCHLNIAFPLNNCKRCHPGMRG